MENKAGGLLYNLLIQIACNQYREDLSYFRLYAGIIESGLHDQDYLDSPTFWRDCKMLGVTDELVMKLIKEVRVNLK